jgi:SHS2 domain-containing protein
MPKYRLIEHTADIGLVASGNTLAEAFANAASGMFSIMTDLRRVAIKKTRRIELTGRDMERLFFDWLNTLLYYFDVEGLLFRSFDVSLTDGGLAAACRGEKYDPARHRLKLGVKSATYHRLEVDRVNNRVRVIFDV